MIQATSNKKSAAGPPMDEYMVSYQLVNWPNQCGNKTGTLDDVKAYTAANIHQWKSFTFFKVLPSSNFVHELQKI